MLVPRWWCGDFDFGVVLAVTVTLVEVLDVQGILRYPPTMTQQPPGQQELFFKVNSSPDDQTTLVLPCLADGKPSPAYFWTKNGEEIDFSIEAGISLLPGRGDLEITSPRKDDEGWYQCRASNSLGTASSNPIHLRHVTLREFSALNSVTKTVVENDPVGLQCQAPKDDPPPSLSWLNQRSRGGTRNITSPRVTVDPEGTLWFSSVTLTDSSTEDSSYVCVAYSVLNHDRRMGRRILLQVVENSDPPPGRQVVENSDPPPGRLKAPGKLFVSPEETTVLTGARLKLWCIFSGVPESRIQWTREDKEDLPVGRVEYENYGRTLVIHHMEESDGGQYQCLANNGVGSPITNTFKVHVQVAPYLVVSPENQHKVEGEDAVLHCKARGQPPPMVTWTRNTYTIPNPSTEPRLVATASSLTFNNLTMDDTGNYGCNASNIHGFVYEDAYINVLGGLVFDDTTIDAVVGKPINLDCDVTSATIRRCFWERESDAWEIFVDDVRKDIVSGISVPQDTWHNQCGIVVNSATLEDHGTWTCKVYIDGAQLKKSKLVSVSDPTGHTNHPNVECAPPFTLVGHQCILLWINTSGSWAEMKTLCEDLGAAMLKVEDANFLYDFVEYVTANGLDNYHFWIGGTDNAVEGDWRWTDRSQVKMGTPFWGDLDTNIQEPQGKTVQNCLYMNKDDHFYFFDGVCKTPLQVICQVPTT